MGYRPSYLGTQDTEPGHAPPHADPGPTSETAAALKKPTSRMVWLMEKLQQQHGIGIPPEARENFDAARAHLDEFAYRIGPQPNRHQGINRVPSGPDQVERSSTKPGGTEFKLSRNANPAGQTTPERRSLLESLARMTAAAITALVQRIVNSVRVFLGYPPVIAAGASRPAPSKKDTQPLNPEGQVMRPRLEPNPEPARRPAFLQRLLAVLSVLKRIASGISGIAHIVKALRLRSSSAVQAGHADGHRSASATPRSDPTGPAESIRPAPPHLSSIISETAQADGRRVAAPLHPARRPGEPVNLKRAAGSIIDAVEHWASESMQIQAEPGAIRTDSVPPVKPSQSTSSSPPAIPPNGSPHPGS